MGRRWGKTTMSSAIALSVANHGGKVAWLVPTYKNARPLWRTAQTATAQAVKAKAAILNNSELTIAFPRTNGWLGIYTGVNDVAMRGEDFDLVIPEEAAKLKASTFYDVVLPTLADRDGRLLIISTPAGRNWYWREAMRALADTSGESAFWTAPSRDNPNPKIQRAYDLAKAGRVSRNTFRQEWDAEFLEGEGTVFSNITRCATIKPPVQPYQGTFIGGLDFAQKRDYTVLIVLDAENMRMVDMLRVNKCEWKVIRQRIIEMCQKWHIKRVIGESNSIGQPNIEALQDAGVPVQPFETTAVSKSPLIESLVLAFEQEEIAILDDPVLKLELEAYEKKVNPITGRPTYSAPIDRGDEDGETGEDEIHDDCVMALALALYGITNSNALTSLPDSVTEALDDYFGYDHD